MNNPQLITRTLIPNMIVTLCVNLKCRYRFHDYTILHIYDINLVRYRLLLSCRLSAHRNLQVNKSSLGLTDYSRGYPIFTEDDRLLPNNTSSCTKIQRYPTERSLNPLCLHLLNSYYSSSFLNGIYISPQNLVSWFCF